MEKTQVEHLKNIKSSLRSINISISLLEALISDLMKTNRTHKIPNSQFKIKGIKREDLS
jgi:hypothetical protein